MPDHHFNPALAKEYGLDAAVFLHNIYFWMKHNKAYQKNFYEGRYWTFNSLAAFCEAHPYWSRRQIERIVSACKKNGLLLTGCFNADRRDRTSWYTLSDKALAYFADVTTEMADCISPFGEMHDTERGQSFHQTGTPLPDINPDNSQTDNPPKAPQGAAGRKSKYALQDEARPLLRAYVGQDQELAWALADFIQLREQLRAVNSAVAIKVLLSKLDKLSGGDRVVKLQLIEEAMANSWKSVFPLRGGQTRAAAPPDRRVVEREEVPTW